MPDRLADHLPPPPRRPAPEALRHRIGEDLERAQRRRRFGLPLVTLAAAVGVVIATVLGVSAYRSSLTAEPASTVAPVSPSTAPTPLSASPAPSSAGPASSSAGPAPSPSGNQLAVRSLNAGEVANNQRACDAGLAKDERAPASARLVYARSEQWPGLDGPTARRSTVLITEAGDGKVWSCVDHRTRKGGSPGNRDRVTAAAPVQQVDGYPDTAGSCDQGSAVSVFTDALYAVGPSVVLGRVRLSSDGRRGPWQTITPQGGYLHFSIGLAGKDAWRTAMVAEYQFLGADGKPVVVQRYGTKGTPTTTKVTVQLLTCNEISLGWQDDPEPNVPPASTKAGTAACTRLAAKAAGRSFDTDGWQAELVAADKDSWGAVLRKGGQRFACSLAPTREVGETVEDTATLAKSSFWFAVNSIEATDGSSFWAAGRVPDDVTAITYELPGDIVVPATLTADGTWMVMYHRDGADLADGDVSSWDPVTVTIARRSGKPVVYSIPFNEKTMCNQISHGC